MGESVSEATIITWTKEIGEKVELDETIVEIATDKVDSEVPSTHEGILVEKFFNTDDVVQVGDTFAILETEETAESENNTSPIKDEAQENKKIVKEKIIEEKSEENNSISTSSGTLLFSACKKYSKKEGLSLDELNNINGTGKEGRVTKSDIISYIATKDNTPHKAE